MAGPEGEMATGAGGRGCLRASHADREQVIGVLKVAFVQGRLDRDEFGQRVGQALGSRTHAELAALTTDIPAGLTVTQPHKAPAPEVPDKNTVKALACATAAVTSPFVAWFAMTAMTDGGFPARAAMFLVIVVTVLSVPLAAVLLAVLFGRFAGRQSSPGLPPGAGGEATARHPAPADPAGRLSQVDRDRRQAPEARQELSPRAGNVCRCRRIFTPAGLYPGREPAACGS